MTEVRVPTERLLLVTLDIDEWSDIAHGRARDAVADYPTPGDVIVAGLLVAGDWPADEWGPLQVRRRADGIAIGGVGCKGRPDERGCVEIGYGLAESARGHGYATEAVSGLLAWLADQGVREVVAECDDGNTPSMAVLRRCGFAPDEGAAGMTIWKRVLSPSRP